MLGEDILTYHIWKKRSHEGIYEDPRANQQEQKLDFNKSQKNKWEFYGRTPGDIRETLMKYKYSLTQTHTRKHIIKNNIHVQI